MSAALIDAAAVAAPFREETRARVAALRRELRVVGLLSQSEGPAHTYAQYARLGAEEVGIKMDIWEIGAGSGARSTPEEAVREANADPTVDGIFLYYPLADSREDRWLRELVDPRKDVEGMHSFWTRLLYENQRFVDDAHQARAILPCTPLGILKLIEAAGVRERCRGDRAPLEGVVACVINRSEIVGRPLSAMLANDGATVISLDIDHALAFSPAIGQRAYSIRDTEHDRTSALAQADVVITGVPTREFPLVTADEIKPGAICLNFSQYRNFEDSILEVASAFVPRVGPMTVAMATRNLLRLADLHDLGL